MAAASPVNHSRSIVQARKVSNIMNTISYKDLKQWYINNDEAVELANKVFGNKQPQIHRTGFYSSPGANWAYIIGVVQVDGKFYEVVTRFGGVDAAREVYIPELSKS